jgi:hypothetical protein
MTEMGKPGLHQGDLALSVPGQLLEMLRDRWLLRRFKSTLIKEWIQSSCGIKSIQRKSAAPHTSHSPTSLYE